MIPQTVPCFKFLATSGTLVVHNIRMGFLMLLHQMFGFECLVACWTWKGSGVAVDVQVALHAVGSLKRLLAMLALVRSQIFVCCLVLDQLLLRLERFTTRNTRAWLAHISLFSRVVLDVTNQVGQVGMIFMTNTACVQFRCGTIWLSTSTWLFLVLLRTPSFPLLACCKICWKGKNRI